MLRLASTTFLTALTLSFGACAQANSPSDLNKSEIEAIVKAYLLENPEVVRDALIALEEKEERQVFDTVREDLFNNPLDPVIGPEDAKVTIVEFFDYNCSFCKRSTDWLQSAINEHGDDIRVIFKELPILDRRTQTSRTAARAALAAHAQDKYEEMHFALMAERTLSEDRIMQIAQNLNLDIAKFRSDMESPEIASHIDDTILLAAQLPMLTGTPFFMINDDYISGANTERLNEMLDSALAAG